MKIVRRESRKKVKAFCSDLFLFPFSPRSFSLTDCFRRGGGAK
jgi:hypothetical protein